MWFSLCKETIHGPKVYKLIKIDLSSEAEDVLEARWALRRQVEDLNETSKPTARAVADEGGQTRPRSATTRTFDIARGDSQKFEVHNMTSS